MSDDITVSRDIVVIYDGDCPFCSSFVTLYRLRESGMRLHLVDARSSHPLIDDVVRRGLDLDNGMVVKFGDRFYYGSEAMEILAILGSPKTYFNRINRALFRRPGLARLLYPILVRGRLITLRLLGRPTIHEA